MENSIFILSLIRIKVNALSLFEESQVPPKLFLKCNTEVFQCYQLKESGYFQTQIFNFISQFISLMVKSTQGLSMILLFYRLLLFFFPIGLNFLDKPYFL